MRRHHPDSETNCDVCGLTYRYGDMRKQDGILKCRWCLDRRVVQTKKKNIGR